MRHPGHGRAVSGATDHPRNNPASSPTSSIASSDSTASTIASARAVSNEAHARELAELADDLRMTLLGLVARKFRLDVEHAAVVQMHAQPKAHALLLEPRPFRVGVRFDDDPPDHVANVG